MYKINQDYNTIVEKYNLAIRQKYFQGQKISLNGVLSDEIEEFMKRYSSAMTQSLKPLHRKEDETARDILEYIIGSNDHIMQEKRSTISHLSVDTNNFQSRKSLYRDSIDEEEPRTQLNVEQYLPLQNKLTKSMLEIN